MHIVHVALQGCLRGGTIEYGRTADTGGHIRYLVELVAAVRKLRPGVRQTLVTRAFKGPGFDPRYHQRHERVADGIEIVRLYDESSEYLSKEELWRHWPALAGGFRAFTAELSGATLVHAHYADAAVLASSAGLPFFFTGHSLGRVKTAMAGHLDQTDRTSLQKRVHAEELGLAQAHTVFASSEDEVRVQIGLYRARPRSVVVNPPGCNLEALQANAGSFTGTGLERQLRRALLDPALPPVVAVARPVRRKNLVAVVQAFAEAGLARQHNLVILAGTRDAGGVHEGEAHEVICEILETIDQHGLYGRAAFPRTHRPEDVPGLYRWARERGGVFVNPALQEPFGLTVLEAAAAGLPTVATCHGGPAEIIARCGHGETVDPTRPGALSSALVRALQDGPRWRARSLSGANEARFYSWTRHAARYMDVADAALACSPRRPVGRTGGSSRDLLQHVGAPG